MRHNRQTAMALAVVASMAAAPFAAAELQTVYFTDFDSGTPAGFSGAGGIESVGGFAGIGHAGNKFAGNYWRNRSQGTTAASTVLTLTDLAAHDAISISFLLAAIDSWDGYDWPWGTDYFCVLVDGVVVFDSAFSYYGIGPEYTPAPGGAIYYGGNLVGNSVWNDRAYDMSYESKLSMIPHTSSTLTIEFLAHGTHWQGLDDESWAIDNLRVMINPTAVPGPATLALLAGAPLIARRRRRR